MKPPKPNTYSAAPRAKVTDFTDQLEQYYALVQVHGDADRINYAAALLRGPAATWWRTLRLITPENVPVTWDAWKAALEKQFVSLNPTKVARDRLVTCRQTTSVRDYTHRFNLLVLEIPGMTEEERVDKCLRGLKPYVRREVEFRDPSDLAQASAMAERLDALSFRAYHTVLLTNVSRVVLIVRMHGC